MWGNESSLAAMNAGEREALERLAARDTREALRARAVIGLLRGFSKAEVAREIAVSPRSVHSWEKLWAAGGLRALVERRGGRGGHRPGALPRRAGSLPAAIPAGEAGILAATIPRGRGRRALSRLAIEAWVRDAAALGRLDRGAALPGRAWFRAKFGASSDTVAAAAESLARQGFVTIRPRGGTVLRDVLPFDSRYLLVLASDIGGPAAEGLDIALHAAALEAEKSRGASWRVLSDLPAGEEDLSSLLAEIASQRYAGAFLRGGPQKNPAAARLLALGRVPVMFFSAIGGLPKSANFAVVRHDDGEGDLDAEARLFGALAASGRRRALVVDAIRRHPGFARRSYAMGRAAGFGIEIPDGCYQLLAPEQPEQAALVIAAAVRAAVAAGVDSVAVLQDNFVEPTCRCVAEAFGRDAARLAIVAAGHRPVVHHPCLPVEWHGEDVGAAVRAFIDWCDAFHAGSARRLVYRPEYF